MSKKAVSVRVTKKSLKDRRSRALSDLAAIIDDLWGPKCPSYDYGCPTCIAWKALEEMEQLTDENRA